MNKERMMTRHPRSEIGSALTESLVWMTAVVPIFLAMPLLAKYQEISIETVSAARSVAFECALDSSSCASYGNDQRLTNRLIERHFTLKNGVSGSKTQYVQHAWKDGGGNQIIKNNSDVTVQVTDESLDSVRNGMNLVPIMKINPRAWLAGPNSFGLKADGGLIKSRVQTTVSRGATWNQWMQLTQALELKLVGQVGILHNAWMPTGVRLTAGPESLEARVNMGKKIHAPIIGNTPDAMISLGYLPIKSAIRLFSIVDDSAKGITINSWRPGLVPMNKIVGNNRPTK